MPNLNVRISDSLLSALNLKVSQQGFNDRSEFVRSTLEAAVSQEKETVPNWQVKVWSLFGVDAEQFRFAYKRSNSPDEFWSILSKHSKIPLRLIYNEQQVMTSFSVGNDEILIQKPRSMPFDQQLQEVTNELKEKIIGDFENAL